MMKHFLILLMLTVLAACVSKEKAVQEYPQQVPAPKVSNEQNVTEPLVAPFLVDRIPVFPGCDENANKPQLLRCLSQRVGRHVQRKFNMQYFTSRGIESHRIMASFVISSDGHVVKVTSNEKIPQLLQETKRVLLSLPKMMPAIQNDKAVATSFALPIRLVVK